MPENEEHAPAETLNKILAALQSAEEDSLRGALNALQELPYGSEAIRNQLEKLALQENISAELQQAARAALDLPAQRAVRARVNRLNPQERRVIAQELESWKALGLLDAGRAETLLQRYRFDAPPKTEAAQPVQSAPAAPPVTLAGTLLSEGSVKIALYLGAFFVVSAAAILGAFVESFRIPLLMTASLLFGGLSMALRKRLPQPSFALFIVFSFLLPITASVIKNTLALSPPFIALYWVFISLLMAVIWGGSARLFESRLFSVLAFLSIAAAFYRVGDFFQAESELTLLLLGAAEILALPVTWALMKWKDRAFAMPLFITAHLLQAGILIAALVLYSIRIFNAQDPRWHLFTIPTLTLAFIFYLLADRLIPLALYNWLGSAALFGIPWLIATAFEIETPANAALFFGWGFILAIASEAAYWLKKTRKHSLSLLAASILAIIVSATFGFTDSLTNGFIAALSAAVLYKILHLTRPRPLLWAFSIFSFSVSYFTLFNLPFLETAKIFLGYQILGINALLFMLDMLIKDDAQNWLAQRLVPPVLKIFGGLFAFLATIFYLFDAGEEVGKAAILFSGYTLLFALYALRKRKAYYGYLPAFYLPLFLIFLLRNFEIQRWIHVTTALALTYYGLGFILRRKNSTTGWAQTWLVSGFILASLSALAGIAFDGLDSALPAIAAAALFTVEAFTRKNVWLGFPANGFYLLAYFILLFQLDVNQPQFYSMGAALLGLIQHYLLTRIESKGAVFLMGMLSQFVLLGTTYIQMVANGSEGLIYFLVLFLQALATLTYGVVIRSRSLTLTPIAFSVLGVMSVLYIVAYNLLDVIATIVLIGCAGTLLLGLGILAVVMRERITQFSGRFNDWKA